VKLKVFVTGASGMLGTTLYDVFTNVGYEIISTDLSPLDPWTVRLDVRNKRVVRSMIKKAKPDFVFNLAALTDVEFCELHPQEAYDTNAEGALNVAYVCKEFGVPLVHISTAGVFDGGKGLPYSEEDTPNPINYYGKAKCEAEKEIPKILDNYFIFRAGWMMGSGERDKKFVKKVIDQIKGGAKTIYALTDMYGCPTYTRDFSHGILYMLSTNDYGLYNMGGEGYCSRYDVAKKIVEVLKLDTVTVEPVTQEFFSKAYFAPRPSFEVLLNKKLYDRNYNLMRNWEEALVEYLTYYEKHRSF